MAILSETTNNKFGLTSSENEGSEETSGFCIPSAITINIVNGFGRFALWIEIYGCLLPI